MRWAKVHVASPHIWDDLPPIPGRFDISWHMKVLPEGDVARACSDALVEHGMWEPAQTLAMLYVFEQLPRHGLIDCGANVGYYSMLADALGLSAIAIEEDPEIFEVLASNAQATSSKRGWISISPLPMSIDGSRLPLDLYDGRLVVKIDLEGADYLALKSICPFMEMVDAVLIELSPIFNDTWNAAVNLLYSAGLVGALIPLKSTPPPKFESLHDLDWRHTPQMFKALMSGVDQRDALFVRPEAVEL
jgi:hypothetical protein